MRAGSRSLKNTRTRFFLRETENEILKPMPFGALA